MQTSNILPNEVFEVRFMYMCDIWKNENDNISVVRQTTELLNLQIS
jgi:hypothetical protein